MTQHEDDLGVVKRNSGVVILADNVTLFAVQSTSDEMDFHHVTYDPEEDVWRCPCRGFRYTDDCRHITKAKKSLDD